LTLLAVEEAIVVEFWVVATNALAVVVTVTVALAVAEAEAAITDGGVCKWQVD
jgi:hypothetical protein